MEEEEIWVKVSNFQNYSVSSFGNVRIDIEKTVSNRFYPIRNLTQCSDRDGYKLVTLRNSKGSKMFRVHRLVCFAFHPNPENKELVNHKDGVKWNNNKDNLEWCTPKENNQHALKTGLVKTGIHSPSYGKRNSQYGKVGALNNFAKAVINTVTGETFGTCKEAAESIGMTTGALSDRLCKRTKNNTNFKYLNE